MGDPFAELRHAARVLRRRPGFALTAILLLTIGIGAAGVVVTLARATFGTYPPHVPEPERLVRVTRTAAEVFAGAMGYPDYAFLRDENRTLAGLAAYDRGLIPVMARTAEAMRQVTAGLVSGEYFAVLGTRPAAGRFFRPDEDRGVAGPRAAVISHDLWTTLFGAQPGVAGSEIVLGAEPFEVIGVAPAGFRGPTLSEPTPDVWVPLTLEPILGMGEGTKFERIPDAADYWLEVIGRLQPGIAVEAAAADLGGLAARLEQAFGAWNEGVGVRVSADVRYQPNLRRRLVRIMSLLGAVTATILAIACANVALLLLARGAARSREMGIRRSLGAGRGRLVRHLLSETLLLAGVGAALGIVLAVWSSRAVGIALLDGVAGRFQPDLAAIGFIAAITLGAVVLCGLAPALLVSRPGIVDLLRDGTGGATRGARLRVGLVITQVALSLVLVTGAGLLVRSIVAAQAVELGFATEHRLLVPVNLERQGYTEARAQQFLREALERIATLPGVEAATLTHRVPFRGMWSTGFLAEGARAPGGDGFESGANAVGPGYFAAMGIPVLAGREFTGADDATRPFVAVVNQTLARDVWGDADPIGRIIGDGRDLRVTVVGVVRDARYYDLGEPAQPQLYLTPLQLYRPALNILVRTAGPPAGAAGPVTAALRDIDPGLVVGSVTTMDEVVERQLRPYRTLGVTVTAVGVIALVLAALGLYGVLAYLVAQRTREFGIRLALGARAGSVAREVIGQGMRLASLGIVVGGVAAWLTTRLVGGFLFGVGVHDPLAFVAGPIALTGAAVAASYVPARRAGAIHPMEALRHE